MQPQKVPLLEGGRVGGSDGSKGGQRRFSSEFFPMRTFRGVKGKCLTSFKSIQFDPDNFAFEPPKRTVHLANRAAGD